jgi:hypothetical protein
MVYKCIIRLLSLIIGLNLIFLMIRLAFTKTNSTIQFHDDCCFYRFGLFIKLFCCLLLSCAAFENARLVNTSSIINNKIIAGFFFLFFFLISIYLYCLFRFGYIIGGAHS